ncbi:histone H2A-Bbd type 1-like [Dasypus novemcinctus]|uniref:histone H2A-Bbd type 1-like n=1 Tax=Dasypus novemcinctus TaxID=9361 RepID=UPI000328A70A|nr:histone H2A-Bbd type 1-like [Dasypus novemcinctus]
MRGKKSRQSTYWRRRPALSRSTRAELQFPVSRVDRVLRESHCAQRLSLSTPVFLAGILEYLTANVLELASHETGQRKRITPENVEKAVSKNPQLSRVFGDDINPQGDYMPHPRNN